MPNPDGSPTYEELVQMVMAQQGGGMQQNPYNPPTVPKTEGAYTPQYRTQFTPYLSDGTAGDLIPKLYPNPGDYSADALFAADPTLKPLLAKAVTEAGHDPYAVLSLGDDPEYRQMMINMAMQDADRTERFDPALLEGKDENDDGQVDDGATWTNDDAIQNIISTLGNGMVEGESQFADFGSGRQFRTEASLEDTLKASLGKYQDYLNDFSSQAAPSTQRNIQDVSNAWGSVGGMPSGELAGGGNGQYGDGSYEGMGGVFGGDPTESLSAREYIQGYMNAAKGDRRITQRELSESRNRPARESTSKPDERSTVRRARRAPTQPNDRAPGGQIRRAPRAPDQPRDNGRRGQIRRPPVSNRQVRKNYTD